MIFNLRSKLSRVRILRRFELFQLLLRKKAAEELKKEQERKSAERRKVIDQRCGKPTSTDGMSESKSLIKLVHISKFTNYL